jgi:periplasmic divalent cation tolerance protein
LTSRPQIVLCTCPDHAVATSIAEQVVERGLAACVNLVKGVESIYRWQGKVEHDHEYLLIIKTTAECFGDLEKCICKSHPYELPELIVFSIQGGSKAYLDWIGNNVGRDWRNDKGSDPVINDSSLKEE